MSSNDVVIIDSIDHFNLSRVLQRPYWNRKLLDKLLPEPDHTETRGNGTITRKLYSLQRVFEAEKSGTFLAKKDADDQSKAQREERAEEVREGLEKAIELDMKQLKIPLTGEIDEVFDTCMEQMLIYNDMLKVADMSAYCSVYSPHSDGGILSPEASLYRKIAQERPELAFEAGRRYQMNCVDPTGHHFGSAAHVVREGILLR